VADITFDDLIPNTTEIDFSDLVPKGKAPVADPVRETVRRERDAERAKGVPELSPTARLAAQGATFGLGDEARALAGIPAQMYRRGTFNPATAYEYSKAREDLDLEDARAQAGGFGTAAEIAGGVGTGANLYKAGLTFGPAIASRLGSGLIGTAAGAAADGVAYGALAGAAEANGADRLTGAVKAAAVGGALGATIPAATAAVGMLAAPAISNISARVNPSRYADRQLLQAATESGQTPAQVADRVGAAVADGQTEYRLLDALDNAGRRKAAVVAKNPGEGRQQLVEFLDQRQAGQGGRVAQAVEEGLGASETAQAATARMAAARRAQDNEAFGAVRNDAGHVNVRPALDRINSVLQPGEMGRLNEGTGIAYDSVEAALARARALLTDGRSQTVGFEQVQRARGDIADAVEVARRAGAGNKARLLRGVRDDLDTALQGASPGFREAMQNSAARAREIESVDVGGLAARRGRSEDKIAAFGGLTPEEQSGFRVGYADPLIARAQAAPMNTDAARPLTSLAARTELPAFAVPGQGDQMMRRLGRESEMFRNRAAATGGSTTAENLADNAATGVDTAIIGRLLSGDFLGAGRNALQRGVASVSGNTEAVRARLAERLLNGSPDEIRTLLESLVAQSARRSDNGARVLRGALGGVTPALSFGQTANQPTGR
jgi:hypothetical protein